MRLLGKLLQGLGVVAFVGAVLWLLYALATLDAVWGLGFAIVGIGFGLFWLGRHLVKVTSDQAQGQNHVGRTNGQHS